VVYISWRVDRVHENERKRATPVWSPATVDACYLRRAGTLHEGWPRLCSCAPVAGGAGIELGSQPDISWWINPINAESCALAGIQVQLCATVCDVCALPVRNAQLSHGRPWLVKGIVFQWHVAMSANARCVPSGDIGLPQSRSWTRTTRAITGDRWVR
jgi:hypothetical protein